MRLGPIKLLEKRVIGPPDNPLLVRYVLFRAPWFGIWIHKLCRSDHDRATHTHPWSFISVVLKNGYDEIAEKDFPPSGRQQYLKHRFGAILYRRANWSHRVIIKDKPAWTLVVVFRNKQKWGFWPDGKWCYWRNYDTNKGICEESFIHPDSDD